MNRLASGGRVNSHVFVSKWDVKYVFCYNSLIYI